MLICAQCIRCDTFMYIPCNIIYSYITGLCVYMTPIKACDFLTLIYTIIYTLLYIIILILYIFLFVNNLI